MNEALILFSVNLFTTTDVLEVRAWLETGTVAKDQFEATFRFFEGVQHQPPILSLLKVMQGFRK